MHFHKGLAITPERTFAMLGEVRAPLENVHRSDPVVLPLETASISRGGSRRFSRTRSFAAELRNFCVIGTPNKARTSRGGGFWRCATSCTSKCCVLALHHVIVTRTDVLRRLST